MAEIRRETQHPSGMKLGDILFALFKRKRTIMVCATVGIIAAAAVYFFFPPSYESQAKLLVRYVLERSGVDPIEAEKAAAAANTEADRVIGAEMEILDQLGFRHASRPGNRSPAIAAASARTWSRMSPGQSV